jgi:hypothetical protein
MPIDAGLIGPTPQALGGAVTRIIEGETGATAGMGVSGTPALTGNTD